MDEADASGDEESQNKTLLGTHTETSVRPLALMYSVLAAAEICIAIATQSPIFWTESWHLVFDTCTAWALALSTASTSMRVTPVAISIVSSSMTLTFMLHNLYTIVVHITGEDRFHKYADMMIAISLCSLVSLLVTWTYMRKTCRLGCCDGVAAKTMYVHVVADIFGSASMCAVALACRLHYAHVDRIDMFLAMVQTILLIALSARIVWDCIEWVSGSRAKCDALISDLKTLPGLKTVNEVYARYNHGHVCFDVAIHVNTAEYKQDMLLSLIQTHGQLGILQVDGLMPFFSSNALRPLPCSHCV